MASAPASRVALNSTKSAVALVVPAHLRADVDALRKIHDKAYRKWPPHINILYPFVDLETLPNAINNLKDALQSEKLNSIKACINSVNNFTHRRNATVFLQPSSETEENLNVLRNKLVAALGCKPSDGTHDGEFRPHLTIGQASLIGGSIERLTQKAEKVIGLEWQCLSLAVLRREPSGEMVIVEELPLNESSANDHSDEITEGKGRSGWARCFGVSDVDQTWSQITARSSKSHAISADESGSGSIHPKASTLAITSYNLMTEPLAPAVSERMPLLLRAISQAGPPKTASIRVLCLQEVGEEMLSLLLSDPNIQHKYPYSTHGPSSMLPSRRNLVTLSSVPFTYTKVDFAERHKSSLVVQMTEHPITVANIHLQSALTDETVKIKWQQMNTITRFLHQYTKDWDVFLAGDFNLTTSSRTIETALEQGLISPESRGIINDVVDTNVWNDAFDENGFELEGDDSVYPGEGGATYDRQTNPLTTLVPAPIDDSPQRYDRILFSSKTQVQVMSFDILGLPDVAGHVGSDHYGISALLNLNPTDSHVNQNRDPHAVESTQSSSAIAYVQDATDLVPLIQSILPTAEDRVLRKEVLRRLQTTLSGTEKLSDVILASLGSYSMDTYFSSSDMDLLAIGSATPRTFFDHATRLLRALGSNTDFGDDGLKAVHFINSLVPIIEVIMMGVKIDLQYCQATELVERYHSIKLELNLRELVFERSTISSLHPSSLRPLNTYRDTAYLLNTIPHLDSYRTAHRYLSLYLKRRGLYSAKFGYLGGIHLSLMLNHLLKRLKTSSLGTERQETADDLKESTPSPNHGGDITPAGIVRTFFSYYASFNWAHDIVSDGVVTSDSRDVAMGGRHQRSPREPVVIESIFRPTARPNVAASCNRLSAQTFTSEFTLAAQKVSQQEWEWCLRPQEASILEFFHKFGAYVRIKLSMWDIEDIGGDRVRELVGTLESKITGLMVALGRSESIEGRVWPSRLRTSVRGNSSDSELEGFYVVGVSAKHEDLASRKALEGKVVTAVRDFERLVRGTRSFDPSHAWIEADVVPKRKILEMDLCVDERDWANIKHIESAPPIESGGPAEQSNPGDAHVVHLSEPSSSGTQRRRSSTRLRPAHEVISQIKWDPNLDATEYLIGFEDRFLGVQEKELLKWKMEQTDLEFIPVHRIVWIRRDGDVEKVWDRKAKVDRLG